MLKILVADRDREHCTRLASSFAKAGQKCFTVHSGRRAIEAARQHWPDIVIVDYQLDDMPGAEALARIQRVAPCCAVLTSSARDIEDRARPGSYVTHARLAASAGAAAYLTKPFDPELLAHLLRVLPELQSALESRDERQPAAAHTHPTW